MQEASYHKEKWEEHAANRKQVTAQDLTMPKAADQANTSSPSQDPGSTAASCDTPQADGPVASSANVEEQLGEPPTAVAPKSDKPTTGPPRPKRQKRAVSAPPAHAATPPAGIPCQYGETAGNKRLISEWKAYLDEVVANDIVFTQVDADEQLSILVANCRKAQISIDAQSQSAAAALKQAQDEIEKHPMPIPERPPLEKSNHRTSPFK